MADVTDTVLLADGVPYVEGMALWGRDGGPLWPDRAPADRVEAYRPSAARPAFRLVRDDGVMRRAVSALDVYASRGAAAAAQVERLCRRAARVAGELGKAAEMVADLSEELAGLEESLAYWRSVAEAEAQPAGPA